MLHQVFKRDQAFRQGGILPAQVGVENEMCVGEDIRIESAGVVASKEPVIVAKEDGQGSESCRSIIIKLARRNGGATSGFEDLGSSSVVERVTERKSQYGRGREVQVGEESVVCWEEI